jgi:glutamine cyclotransferase
MDMKLSACMLTASLLLPGALAAQSLQVEVISVRPHDTLAFTQGLLLFEGSLYESTGLYGQSTLRQVNPQTGRVLHQTSLAPTQFGEGLARVGRELIQLTWREQTAIVWSLDTFTQVRSHTYAGQGWGLCYDGQHLIMSDGSDELTFRDPSTFAQVATLAVRDNGTPVYNLNELECVGGAVLANIWTTDSIVIIDKSSGAVTARIDASALGPDITDPEAVLNGIAHDPDTDTYLVTGKLWPHIYEVRWIAAGSPAPLDGDDSHTSRVPTSSLGCTASAPPAVGWITCILAIHSRRRRERNNRASSAAASS